MINRKPQYPAAAQGVPLFGKAKDRDAVLARMRGKLAAPSMDLQAAGERREARKVRRAWGWTWKLYLVAAIIVVNAAYFGLREQAAGQAPLRRAPALPHWRQRALLGRRTSLQAVLPRAQKPRDVSPPRSRRRGHAGY